MRPPVSSARASDRCGDHPDLHSFPTRRSSDLYANSSASRPRSRRALTHSSGSASSAPADVAKASSIAAASTRRMSVQRSEEHTSELQSLRHLVCRLLLEKKKNPLQTLSYPKTL